MKSRFLVGALWFLGALALLLGVGWYRSTMSDAESVHFAINYPAEGAEAGGLGARGADGYLVVNLSNNGLLKKIVQPHVVNLSTHWLTNVGEQTRRIRLDTEGIPYPTTWDAFDTSWNDGDHSFGRELAPGQGVTVDWYITLPRPLPPGDVLVDGAIVVYDADTDERLTRLPLRIVRTDAAAAEAEDCCAPQ